MSKYQIKKKISLAYLGEAHKADYLAFTPLTFKDAKEMEQLADVTDANALDSVDKMLDVIKSKFIDGVITNEDTGEAIKVEADDFDNEISVDIIKHCLAELGGAKSEDFTTA